MNQHRTNAFKYLFEKGNISLEMECIRIWMLQISILLTMIFIHYQIDTSAIGVIGLLFIISLNIPVTLIPHKTTKNIVLFLYASLIILTASCVWYMLGNNGMSSPMTSFSLGVPGIAYYFLGRKHAIIWLVNIVLLYALITIYGQETLSQSFPFPTVKEEFKSIEEFMVSTLMLFVICYIFANMRLIKKNFSNMAMHDQLTGVLNRNGIQSIINYEQKKFKRSQVPFSIMILDIDFFKKVNDNYGHNVGDVVIVKIGEIIEKCTRDSDSTARWGGEEFLVLLPETSLKLATERAEDIRKAVEEFSFSMDKPLTDFNVTVSIGVTEINQKYNDFEKLVGRADQKLYKAKNNGRNNVQST